MASRKRERYKIEPRSSVPFMLELEYESKIIFKKPLVIKEICSWLQTFRPSNPVGSQEHIHIHVQGRCLLQVFRCDFCQRNAMFVQYLLSLHVHLSICLSVTSLSCTKTATRRIKQIALHDSPRTL